MPILRMYNPKRNVPDHFYPFKPNKACGGAFAGTLCRLSYKTTNAPLPNWVILSELPEIDLTKRVSKSLVEYCVLFILMNGHEWDTIHIFCDNGMYLVTPKDSPCNTADDPRLHMDFTRLYEAWDIHCYNYTTDFTMCIEIPKWKTICQQEEHHYCEKPFIRGPTPQYYLDKGKGKFPLKMSVHEYY